MTESFEEWVKDNRDWVKLTKKLNRFEGLKRTFWAYYPDKAHFVYELLQNAEDAQAHEVRFILYDDRIEFEHDGGKLFSFDDVKAITNVGDSTKRDDDTKIGKFGVGFKAVFAYTETPEIESGEFHFQIHDLFVPERLSEHVATHGQTRFKLPFNNPEKSKTQAVREIETLLKALEATTLLFLTHISKIEYILPDSSLGYIRRFDMGNNRYDISIKQPQDVDISTSCFLKFTKIVPVDVDQQMKNFPIAVAFGLKKNDQKVEGSAEWSLAPMDPGRVCIYFPAEKETPKLFFHLHAPFAPTIARDGIKNCPENDTLRDHLADLLADSMHEIRDQGLLNVRTLAILPNDKDNLPEFYKPLLNRLMDEFKEKDLVPMKKSGEYFGASYIFRGQRTLSDLIDDDDLATLLGDEYAPPLWAANPPLLHQREHNFLLCLGICEWTDDHLVRALINMEVEVRTRWLCSKDEAWHQKLYAYLEDHALKLKEIEIIRTNDGAYRKGSECFFPTQEIADDETYPCVSKATYTSMKEENKKARRFLETAGVLEFDEEAEIKCILKKFYSYGFKPSSEKEHFAHLRKFIQFHASNPHKLDIFKDTYLFLINFKNKDSRLTFALPRYIYIDKPFKETGLRNYYNTLGETVEIYPLSGVYLQAEEEGLSCKIICEFAEKIGAKTLLGRDDVEMILRKIQRNESERCIQFSKLIWNSIDEKYGSILYDSIKYHRGGGYYGTRLEKSNVCHLLQIVEWIPQKNSDGIDFVPPSEASADKLPKGFMYKPEFIWLHDLQFGENIKRRVEAEKQKLLRQTEEYKREEAYLQKIGFHSSEDAKEMARLKRENPESYERWKKSLHQDKNKPFPSKPVINPERRQEQIREQLSSAPTKEYEKRERSIRTTTPELDPIPWLREQYTNENGDMFCQICKDVLPFKKRNGEYYFEKKEIFSDLPNEHAAQYLALCPLHAAMYKEFISGEKEAMSNLKNAISDADDDNREIPITLEDKPTTILFTEAHFLDLKIIIDDLE